MRQCINEREREIERERERVREREKEREKERERERERELAKKGSGKGDMYTIVFKAKIMYKLEPSIFGSSLFRGNIRGNLKLFYITSCSPKKLT